MIKTISTLFFGVTLTGFTLANTPASHDALSVEQIVEQAIPRLDSQSVLVINSATGETLYQKNTQQRMPIASITKLMTAMVLLDAGVDLNEMITVTDDEIDRIKKTSSRLAIGTTLSRKEMLLLMLMSSENRAAGALARTAFPGGMPVFLHQMNQKARSLGMLHTAFYDPTGLEVRNTSTATDLALMVKAAGNYPLIRAFTTSEKHEILSTRDHILQYRNSNALVREGNWDISLQKTGYIREAGRCVVMQATVGSQPLIIVLLAAGASAARTNDAKAIKTWLEARPSTWLAS